MPHKFLLIKLLDQYDLDINSPQERHSPLLKEKLISDLCNSRVELVHICEDTSADAILKKHADSCEGYSTYFLISVKMHKAAPSHKNILLRIISHVNRASSMDYVDVTDKYQVLTC